MPPIAVEGRPPIKTLEGMLDRGIRYRIKSKATGFPLSACGNDNNNLWIPGGVYPRENGGGNDNNNV